VPEKRLHLFHKGSSLTPEFKQYFHPVKVVTNILNLSVFWDCEPQSEILPWAQQ